MTALVARSGFHAIALRLKPSSARAVATAVATAVARSAARPRILYVRERERRIWTHATYIVRVYMYIHIHTYVRAS